MLAGKIGYFRSSTLDPKSISGLSVWFDASDSSTITLNGSAVSQWNDKSGNGYNASQITANNQPAYTSNARNGLAAVTFDGSNDSLVTSSFSDGWTAFTSFIVYQATGIANGFCLLWTRSTDRQRAIVLNTSAGIGFPFSIRGHLNVNTQNDYDSTAYASFNTWYYLTSQWDGSASEKSTAFTGRANGTNRPNQLSGGFVTSNVANTVLRIGNRSDGTRPVAGSIGEILVYSSSLSITDRDRVESYLKTKWGF